MNPTKKNPNKKVFVFKFKKKKKKKKIKKDIACRHYHEVSV